MRIFFDLETIPGQAPWVQTEIALEIEKAIAGLKAPRNYKSAEAIEKFLKIEEAKLHDDAAERYHRCGLDGGRGEIISIAWAIDDQPVQAISRGPEDDAATEASLLSYFFEAIGGDDVERLAGAQWVGHNVLGFDLPFLWKRCVVLAMLPPPYFPHNAKPWDKGVFDTMLEWAGHGGRISQDNLCKALSLPTKESMTGADVYPAWLNGDVDMIAEYNRQDVETVRRIYKRLTFKEQL